MAGAIQLSKTGLDGWKKKGTVLAPGVWLARVAHGRKDSFGVAPDGLLQPDKSLTPRLRHINRIAMSGRLIWRPAALTFMGFHFHTIEIIGHLI